MKKVVLFILCSFLSLSSYAQIDSNYKPLDYIQYVVDRLCSSEYSGRGYVKEGMQKAGLFLVNEMRNRQISPFMQGEYTQNFDVAVNQILKSKIKLDRKKLKSGYDYIIKPNSGSVHGKYRLGHNFTDDKLHLVSLDHYLETTVTMDTTSHLLLSEDATIYPEKAHILFDKNLWQEIYDAEQIHIDYNNVTTLHTIQNIGGIIPGRTDSTIFITAHYDHLGMQGSALYPGASDNASGTALMMALAEYFSKRQPYYTLVLIGFAAEETGLQGSKYFTQNYNYRKLPIKMVINLDIMGNAEEGITVVNTEKEIDFLEKLRSINKEQKIELPEIRQRANTKNSDHYYFTEDGVPAVFIYSNGGQGYYHDVYDTPENLLYTNIDKVFYLLANYILHN